MKEKLKSNKGFSSVDIATSVLIFIMFTGVIAGIMYNIINTNNAVTRKEAASTYMVQILEHAKKLDYEEVTVENLNTYKDSLNIPQGYTLAIEVTKYSDTDETKEDLVKTVKVSVSYNTGAKDTENLEISSVIVKQ